VTPTLPTDSESRKNVPLAAGLLDYFPAALAAVAAVSKSGNEKHNPGEPLHHARGKSTDHADCIMRHLVDRGTVDPEDGQRHSAKVAWRALALLQEELEEAGVAPLPRGARQARIPKDLEYALRGDRRGRSCAGCAIPFTCSAFGCERERRDPQPTGPDPGKRTS
jgi:hypothetical protein